MATSTSTTASGRRAEPDTRARILDEATALANAHGVDAVSVRAVAQALDLSPGNVSYHFPRKVDLVLALGDALTARQDALAVGHPADLPALLERYRARLRHQYEHRGVSIALPHLLETYPEMRRRYRQVERQRFVEQRAHLVELRHTGHLALPDAELDRLVAQLALVARFWLAEYRTTYARRPLEVVIDHYLSLLAALLVPHASAQAAASLRPYLDRMLPLPTE